MNFILNNISLSVLIFFASANALAVGGYSAIAYDPVQGVAKAAHSYSTQDEASQKATERCGSNCVSAGTGFNETIVLAASSKDPSKYAVGQGQSFAEASNAALQNCAAVAGSDGGCVSIIRAHSKK